MKQADLSRGFLMCFLTNLVLHFWWGLAALVLLILHFWLDVSPVFSWVLSVIWGLHALILTLLVSWGNRSSSIPTPKKENKNPYSAKTEDILPKKDEPQDTP